MSTLEIAKQKLPWLFRRLDWLDRRLVWHWFLFVVAAFVLLVAFSWQRNRLYSETNLSPIGELSDYTLEDLETFRSPASGFDVGFYTWSQVGLDFVFPPIYGGGLLIVTCWLTRRQELPRLIVAGVVMLLVSIDYIENVALIAFLNLPNPVSWIGSIASDATWLKKILSIGVALALLFIFYRRNARFIEHQLALRYPIAAIGFLSTWAIAAVTIPGLKSVAASLALLERPLQIVLLALANFLALVFAFAIIRLLKQRSSMASESSLGDWTSTEMVWIAVLASLTPLACSIYSVQQHQIEALRSLWVCVWQLPLLIAGGFTAAIALLFAVGQLSRRLFLRFGNSDGDLFPFQNSFQTEKSASAREPTASPATSDHNWIKDVQLAIYFVLVAFIFFVALRPTNSAALSGAQANASGQILSIPFCVVIMAWLIVLVLSALAFWMRKSRFPVVVMVVLWVILIRFATNHESLLPTIPISEVPPQTSRVGQTQLVEMEGPQPEPSSKVAMNQLESEAWQAARARILRLATKQQASDSAENLSSSRRRTIVIVTCPGGGIHAAAWSAYALQKLDERYLSFSDSIVAISGVSGGSHGAIVFVNDLRIRETDPSHLVSRSNSQRSRVTKSSMASNERDLADNTLVGASFIGESWQPAVQSSLWPLGIGLAFDDIPAALLPRRFESDRGQRLDQAWQTRMQPNAEAQTLQRWGEMAVQGDLPIVVLNATDASSGRRILFSTVRSPFRESMQHRLGRPWDIRELFDFGRYDMHMATAARASATFPYATPFTQPENATSVGERVAIGDGGYVDNEGIVTAVDWAEFLWRKELESRSRMNRAEYFDRIVLLRMQPTSDIEMASPPISLGEQLVGSLRWLAGPFETLATMRVSSQIERGQLETDLLSSMVQSGVLRGTGQTEEVRSAIDQEDQINYQARILTAEKRMMKESRRSKIKGTNEADRSADRSAERAPERRAGRANAAVSERWRNERVLVRSIPFIGDEAEPVPLAWKLSERQKAAYPDAWQRLVEEKSAFFVELDALFEKRTP